MCVIGGLGIRKEKWLNGLGLCVCVWDDEKERGKLTHDTTAPMFLTSAYVETKASVFVLLSKEGRRRG